MNKSFINLAAAVVVGTIVYNVVMTKTPLKGILGL